MGLVCKHVLPCELKRFDFIFPAVARARIVLISERFEDGGGTLPNALFYCGAGFLLDESR